MAKSSDIPGANSFSSTVRKSLLVDAHGVDYTAGNPLPVDAIVTIGAMTLNADLQVDTGHDLYSVPVSRLADLAITFSSIPGLSLRNVQAIENKTQGWVYISKGATVTDTTITLVASYQASSYPVIHSGDEIEFVYRGDSRFTDKSQMARITDGTSEIDVLTQDAAYGTAVKGLPLFGKYETTPTTYADGDAVPIALDDEGKVKLADVDIQIGAVELKNADTNSRAVIKQADETVHASSNVLLTQNIDSTGKVLETDSLSKETTLESSRLLLTSIDTNTTGLASETTIESSRLLLTSIDTNTTGLATEVTIESSRLLLSSIDTKTTGLSSETTAESSRLLLTNIDTNTTGLATEVTAESSRILLDNISTHITTGLATETTVESSRLLLTSIDTNTAGLSSETTAESSRLLLSSIDTNTVGLATEVTAESSRLLLSSIDTNTAGLAAGLATETTLESSRLLLTSIDSNTANMATSFQQANIIAPIDGVANFTTNVTITCSGFPFSVDDLNCTIAYIQVKPMATGVWSSPYINGLGGVSITASGNVITIAGAGTPFVAGDSYIIGIRYQDKAYTTVTNSLRIEEIDPLSQQYVEETLIDTSNLAAGTNYYPSTSGILMGGYKDFTIQGITTGGVTSYIEVTLDDSATPDWLDVTVSGYDMLSNAKGKTSYESDTSFILVYENLNVRAVRINSYTVDTSNTVQYNIRRKAL